MKSSASKKELQTAEFSKIRIEFSEDDELNALVLDNTNKKLGRATTNVLRCLTLISGGSALGTASKLTGIPITTVNRWRSQEWYSRAVAIIQKRLDDQLDGKMTAVINKSLDKLDKRLDEGDAVITRDGTLAFKPVTAKDTAIISSIFFDKRNLLRNKPTSISTKVSTDERLITLANRFKEMAIDAEYEVVEEDEQGQPATTSKGFIERDGRELDEDIRQGDEEAQRQKEDSSPWCFAGT